MLTCTKMLSTLTLIIIMTETVTNADEDNTTSISEEAHNQLNNSALFSNTSDMGFVWADTNDTDCENNTCVRKCCPKWKLYSLPENECVEPTHPNEQLFEASFKHKDGRPDTSTKPVLILTGFPFHLVENCTMGRLQEHLKGRLLIDGTLYTAYDDEYRDNLHYCLDTFRREGEPTKSTTFVCITQPVDTARSIFRYYAHSIGLTLSCIALTIVVLCHALVPKLRDLQGKCLLSHACSLLAGSMALLAATLWQSSNSWLCVTIGIIMHTAYIATYMWLTVMCFDIWRFVRMSVRGIPMQRALVGEENKIFMSYCAVAWGVTGVIALITCTLQFLPDDALLDYIIRPHIGATRCFIIGDDANQFVYYFLILGCLCVLNMGLVGKTAHYLHGSGIPLCCCCTNRKKTDTESSVFNAKHVDVFWQRFQIFIMTIAVWTTEVLSFKIPPKEIWELTDLINTLQGVIILIIFLRQKKKRELVMAVVQTMTNRARTVAQTVITSTETSTTVVSATVSDPLESSEKGKAGRAMTHSTEENPTNEIGLQSLENSAKMPK